MAEYEELRKALAELAADLERRAAACHEFLLNDTPRSAVEDSRVTGEESAYRHAAIIARQALSASSPQGDKGRPSDCADPMRCSWRRMETEPPTDYWFCSEANCPHSIKPLSALPPSPTQGEG